MGYAMGATALMASIIYFPILLGKFEKDNKPEIVNKGIKKWQINIIASETGGKNKSYYYGTAIINNDTVTKIEVPNGTILTKGDFKTNENKKTTLFLTDKQDEDYFLSNSIHYAIKLVKELKEPDTTMVATVNIKDLPYRERVYFALKDNLADFNTPLPEFESKIKDKSYALKIYSALKDNLIGFNKSQEQFLSLVNN